MRGAWEFIIRNDERNPLTNVPRALDVTLNKLNNLWKGLERFSGFQVFKKTSCRSEKLGDFLLSASAAWHGTKSCCDGAWAKVSDILWTFYVYIYMYVYIYIKISANTRTYLRTSTYMNHEIVINTLSNNLWRCWNHVYSIKRIKEPDSVLRCLFGDCFLPAWAAQRRWQGQWHSCSLGHSKCNGIFCVRLVFDLSSTCPLVLFPESKWQPYISSNGIVCLWIQKYAEYLELSCKYAKHLWMWMYWEQ